MTFTITERRRLTALRADWLFDGIGPGLTRRPMVVLDGEKIVAVDAGAQPPEHADVVELTGATLLPGLIDTHVHLAFDASRDPVSALAARSENEVVAAMFAAGRTALHGGVTTVRDLGDRDYLSLPLRGRPDLPEIVAAGPPITTPGGHCHFLGGATEPSEDGVRTAVRERVDRGCDVIKIMASGGTLTPGTRQELAQFTSSALHAAVDEAHRHGRPVTVHAHATDAISDALSAGADGMEHVTFWSAEGVDDRPDLIDRIAESRIVVGATLGTAPSAGGQPPADVARRLPQVIANLRRLNDAGARIVAGTDAGIGPLKPHDVIRNAVPMLRGIGMAPAESLRAVTSTAAKVCGLDHRKGRIARGFDADLLAIDGNPLEDPSALHRIRAVYARGASVER